MKLVLNDDDLRIIPENAQDRSYLVNVIGLNADGANCDAHRCDVRLGFGEREFHCVRIMKRSEK